MSEILKACAERRTKARGLMAYVIKARTPIASNAAAKLGEYSPGAVTFRSAAWMPGTTLFGIAMWAALASPEAPIGRFYPAVPAFSDGGTYGVLACEKSKCTYADFCSATAFEGPKRADLPKPIRVVGIYFDRWKKTAKYGMMYSYQLYPPGASFVTASTTELPTRQRLGYKKGYGWGEVEIVKLCEATTWRSDVFVFTAPVPFTAFRNALWEYAETLDVKLGRWAYYLQATNKFYIVGDTPSELYLAPMSKVTLKNKMSPMEVWDLLAEEIKRLKVFRLNGAEARAEEAECVKLKASATAAAPLAVHDRDH